MLTLADEFEEIDKLAQKASEELTEQTSITLKAMQHRRQLLASYLNEIGIENINAVHLNGETYKGKRIWDLV